MRDTNLVNALRCVSTAGGPIGDCKKCPFYKTEPVPEDLAGKVNLTEWSSCDVDMERLTIPDVLVDEHTTRRTMIDGEAVREHAMDFYWRLKAYEDTHMMPSDVTSMRMDMAIIAALFNGVDVDRMKELAEADKDGRLVVLPCKVGGTLWVTGRDNVPREMELEAPDIRAVCTDEDNLCMSTCNRKPDGFCAYRLRNDGADIGKTVFLTREVAGSKGNGL